MTDMLCHPCSSEEELLRVRPPITSPQFCCPVGPQAFAPATPRFDEPAPHEVDFSDPGTGPDHSGKKPRDPSEALPLPSPKGVSQAEMEKHVLTHLPYAD